MLVSAPVPLQEQHKSSAAGLAQALQLGRHMSLAVAPAQERQQEQHRSLAAGLAQALQLVRHMSLAAAPVQEQQQEQHKSWAVELVLGQLQEQHKSWMVEEKHGWQTSLAGQLLKR